MLHIGIDFSITSPAICFWNNQTEHKFENCKFFFLKSSGKKLNLPRNILHMEASPEKNNTLRFTENALTLTNHIQKHLDFSSTPAIFMEGYSMGAKGRLFDIGEATGIFKYHLSKLNLFPQIIPPSVVKKQAFGKGNANKFQMLEAFKNINDSSKISWIDSLITKKQLLSPLTDIVDCFFIANSTVGTK